jgi:AraC-like DNA-binding protein/quercetin dioxygenase-like cupin family protein
MESDFSTINVFFKQLIDFRETINIGDFFFSPHIVHANHLLAKEKTNKKHSQRTFEISLVLTGDVIYTIKNKEVPVRAGDLIIIPPDVEHYWNVLEKGADVFGFMVNISKHGDGSRRDLSLLNDSIKKHNYRIRDFESFDSIIRQVMNEAVEQKTACKEKAVYLIRIAFIELIRTLLPGYSQSDLQSNFPPARGDNKRDIVEIIYYYLQDNLNRPVTLKEISRYVGLSIGRLNVIFKKETGTSIHQEIITRKLNAACKYLRQTDRQIKDIATLVGYDDVNYFYLQFKKKLGTTPTLYRNANKER